MRGCTVERGGSGVLGGRRLMTERPRVSSNERRYVERFRPLVLLSGVKRRLCAAVIGGRGWRYDACGVHDWTATDLRSDVSSDATRPIVRARVSGNGRVGALSGSGAGGAVASWRRGGAGRAVPRAPGVLRVLRQGEIPFWKVSYGYRRVVDPDTGRSRIEIFEPEAQGRGGGGVGDAAAGGAAGDRGPAGQAGRAAGRGAA